jgi:hypothetical protein
MSATVDDLLATLADLVAERVAKRLSINAQGRKSEATEVLPDFYSETDLSRRCGISRRTLQGWRHRGGGPRWIKVGRKVLYPRSDMELFLRRNSGPEAPMLTAPVALTAPTAQGV